MTEFLSTRALEATLALYTKLTTTAMGMVSALTGAADVAPDVLATAGLNPAYISRTATLPPVPSAQHLAALLPGQVLGGAYRPNGTFQRLIWTGSSWTTSGDALASAVTTRKLQARSTVPELFAGANDALRIQAALSSPDVTSVVLESDYVLDAPINIPNNKRLVFRGGSLSLGAGYVSTSAMITMGANARVTGDGVIDGVDKSTDGIRTVQFTAGQKIAGIEIKGCQQAINIDQLENFVVSDVHSHDNLRAGLVINFSWIGRVTRVHSHHNESGIAWWGGDSATGARKGTGKLTISDCHVHDVIGGIWGSAGTKISGTGNILENCSDVGLDAEGCDDVTFSGGTVTNCLNAALATFFGGSGITFSGIVVQQDAGFGPAYKAFAQYTVTGVKLVGIQATVAGQAISCDQLNTLAGLEVIGGTYASSSPTEPVVRLLQSDDAVFSGVIIKSSSRLGYSFEGCERWTVAGGSVTTTKAITGADDIHNSGGIRTVSTSLDHLGKMGTADGVTIRGFAHSICDDNQMDFYSGLVSQNCRLSGDIQHFATVAAGYRGYHASSNRNADVPTAAVTENAL